MIGEQRQVLADTLKRVRERIADLRQQKRSIGEQNTKGLLIEPVLSSLGWDLQSLDEFSREYRRNPQDNPVDYALFLVGAPCLFIEAKALDTDLSDHKWVTQTIAYAVTAGVEWCVLTNGDEYRLYNTHAPVDVEEKLFRKVQVSDPTTEPYTVDTLDLLSKGKMAEKLPSVLWKAHFVDRRVKTALEELVAGPDKGLIRLLNKRVDGLTRSEIQKSLQRAGVRVDFSVSISPTRRITPASVTRPELKWKIAGYRAHRTRCERQAAQATDPVQRERYLEHVAKYDDLIRRFAEAPTADQPVDAGMPRGSAEKGKRRALTPLRLRDLINAGVLRPPLQLAAVYKEKELAAVVRADGTVTFGGSAYSSLSAAGRAATGWPSCLGWTFWKYRDHETGKLEVIDRLRQRYLETSR